MPSPCVDVVADPQFDLVWSGTVDGHVSALHAQDFFPYCSFAAVASEVRAVLPADNYVMTVGATELRVHSRTGSPKSRFATERMGDLYAAAVVQPGQVCMGGTTPSIFMYDVETNRVALQVGVKAGTSVLKTQARGNTVYAGHMDGSIALMDPRSFRSNQAPFDSGFGGGVQSLDVKDKLLCCSGYTLDRGSSYLEGVVRVFDLRMMRPLAPIAFAPGAYRLKFHPVFSGTLILMAQAGQLQVCDALGSHANLQGYHVDARGGVLTGLDVSSSGEVMMVADSLGFLHQWADREHPRLNSFPKTLEQPTVLRQLPNVLPDDEHVPLSLFDTGVPGLRAGKNLLSTWPENMFFLQPQPVPPIPPLYLQNVQPARDGDSIMYSHVPRAPGLLRYQHPFPDPVRFFDPKLLQRDGDDMEPYSPVRSNSGKTGIPLTPLAGGGNASSSSPGPAVPKPPGLYQEKTISYTKLGVSGFDFEFYNRTPFSGLENTLSNSYVNGAVQMLFYMPQVRSALMSHLCSREYCLSCELGLLFKMLERSAGTVCQASNLLRALEHMPRARQLDLVGHDDAYFLDRRRGIALIERFVQFAMEQIKSEREPDDPDVFSALLSSGKSEMVVCKTCGSSTRREVVSSDPVHLTYPDDTTKLSFGALLRQSLRAHFLSGVPTDRDEWCDRCGNKQPSKTHPHEATLSSLPPALVVFSGLGKAALASCDMWKSAGTQALGISNSNNNSNVVNSTLPSDEGDGFVQNDGLNVSTWLPPSIRLSVDASGAIQVEELANDGASGSAASSSPVSAVYTVTALLCHVHDPRKFPGPGHSVLHQKMIHAADKTLRAFFLFNDFQVVRTTSREALNFDGFFKNACVLLFTRSDTDELVPPPPVRNPVTWRPFVEPPLPGKGTSRVTNPVAGLDDLPSPGELLPIDAEFVCLEPDVIKTIPNGTSTMVRPMHLSLARVSVLRADGRVLIDDYIHCTEKVHDYLTRFSGLQPGDLDPATSRHAVTKLKTCYLKLLWLVERGCVFVGHGLSKDFRILNLVVPQAQVRDTVDLFHLPKSRKISLRFLVSYLLDRDIQIETHDSIEDAQSAMAVYRKYEDMLGQGDFETQLQQLYESGRAAGWQSKREMQELESQMVRLLEEDTKS